MPLQITYVFACLVIGNLIDNHISQNHHRRMIITLEASFAILCLILATLTLIHDHHVNLRLEILPIINRLSYALQFVGTGIYLIVLLQVFNWFPAHNIHWVMALWTMMQGLGSVTLIMIDRQYNFIKLFVIGAVYLILTIVDYFWFRMHPAQENIFVEGKCKDGDGCEN